MWPWNNCLKNWMEWMKGKRSIWNVGGFSEEKSSLVVAVEALVSLCVLQLFLWLHHGDTAVEEPQRDFDSVGFKIVLYSVEIKLTFLGLFPPTLCGLEEIPNTAERFLYSITVMMVQYEGLNCCLLWPTSLCFTGNLFLYAFYDLNH